MPLSSRDHVLEQRRSSPGLLLALLGQMSMRRLREAHTALNLTPRQFLLLAVLDDRGAVGQSELGQMVHTDPSILVTMLNPLENAGLVARERDPDDRRRHLVSLTADGERHLAQATEAQAAAEDALLVGLDADQREQLRGLLLAVRAGLGLESSCLSAAQQERGEPAVDESFPYLDTPPAN
jgi:DNA-binding MarR family transcriptional regulator